MKLAPRPAPPAPGPGLAFHPELEQLISEISADTGFPRDSVRASLGDLEQHGLFDSAAMKLDLGKIAALAEGGAS